MWRWWSACISTTMCMSAASSMPRRSSDRHSSWCSPMRVSSSRSPRSWDMPTPSGSACCGSTSSSLSRLRLGGSSHDSLSSCTATGALTSSASSSSVAAPWACASSTRCWPTWATVTTSWDSLMTIPRRVRHRRPIREPSTTWSSLSRPIRSTRCSAPCPTSRTTRTCRA